MWLVAGMELLSYRISEISQPEWSQGAHPGSQHNPCYQGPQALGWVKTLLVTEDGDKELEEDELWVGSASALLGPAPCPLAALSHHKKL